MPCQGTRGLAPAWHSPQSWVPALSAPLVEGLGACVVWGDVGAGTRQRVACSWLPLTAWGPGWLGPPASFGALSFWDVGWLVGDSSLRCYFGTCGGEGCPCPWAPSRLAWEAVEGDLPPPALQQGTCSAQSRTCPQMYQRPSLLPGECSYLTASCLGFPRCRKRLVSGLYCTPCRYKEGCRVKCTEA